MRTETTTVFFTQEEVDAFGKLTGDDGPVHSEDGIVQGGFIISRLPHWVKQLKFVPVRGHERSVSVALDVKFRNKLPVNKQATIEFMFSESTGIAGKMKWRIYDDTVEYCSGSWLVFKVKN